MKEVIPSLIIPQHLLPVSSGHSIQPQGHLDEPIVNSSLSSVVPQQVQYDAQTSSLSFIPQDDQSSSLSSIGPPQVPQVQEYDQSSSLSSVCPQQVHTDTKVSLKRKHDEMSIDNESSPHLFQLDFSLTDEVHTPLSNFAPTDLTSCSGDLHFTPFCILGPDPIVPGFSHSFQDNNITSETTEEPSIFSPRKNLWGPASPITDMFQTPNQIVRIFHDAQRFSTPLTPKK